MRSGLSHGYRRLFVIVPLVVIALVGLLVIASTNSSLLDRYFTAVMVLNFIAAVILVALTAIMCTRLFLQWRRKKFGSQMTFRLTLQIALIAILPSLLLYMVSSRFIGRSIDSWFNVRVEHALDSGVSLSRAAIANYQQQTAERVRLLGYALGEIPQSEWSAALGKLRERYGLANVMITNNGRGIVATSFSVPSLVLKAPGAEILAVADRHGTYSTLLEEQREGSDGGPETSIHVFAVAPISSEGLLSDLAWGSGLKGMAEEAAGLPGSAGLKRLRQNSFYLTAEEAPPEQLGRNIASVTNGYREYQELVLSRDSLRSLFTASLTVSMLLSVLGAFIAAFAYAQITVDPLRQLARGTRKVADGNLSPIVEFSGSNEISVLTQSFNTMISQLSEAQRKVRMRTEQLEQTSHFLKSVLSNLSSGVIVIDRDMNIVTANEGAEKILGPEVAKKGASLRTVAPQICKALSEAPLELNSPFSDRPVFHREIEIARIGSQEPMTLFVRASRIHLSQPLPLDGLSLVIDDMTQVISGQRAIAWGEVARRLAHEIKNPLTPIQLSAERLGMKLSGKLGEKDARLLSQSVSTIVTQVTAMKQMVDDFRNYAKLPPAVLLPTDLNALLEDIAALYHQAGKPIFVKTDPAIPKILADEAQLRQVLHNLVGNSLDALAGKANGEVLLSTEGVRKGERTVGVLLRVTDNGTGFPESILHRSFEPYVTTKPTGTGLGLPMVKKIIDEHKAEIKIENRTDGLGQACGAVVSMVFRTSPES